MIELAFELQYVMGTRFSSRNHQSVAPVSMLIFAQSLNEATKQLIQYGIYLAYYINARKKEAYENGRGRWHNGREKQSIVFVEGTSSMCLPFIKTRLSYN